MKKISVAKLAAIVKMKREEKAFTQEELSALTGINKEMIGRIELERFIPSIYQLKSLANILGFEIVDIFIEKTETTNPFLALRNENLSEKEKEGLDKLFTMMIALRQQRLLRRKYEEELLRRSK